MQLVRLHKTVGVKVGHVQVGGGAPVVVQSMTMTDTADARGTAQQCIELADAGSEMVRVTVNVAEAAAAVPEIKQRMLDAGCRAPLIGDFHYNGHLLLTRYPECARALDKYRINPGNVGTGKRRDEQFSTICKVAVDHAKPVRIGVNGGSLNQELVVAKMQENTDRDLGRSSEDIINECMVLSAIESTALAIDRDLADRRELLVAAPPGADIARVDAVLVERARAVGELRQQEVTVVVEVADERRRHPGIEHALLDLGNRGGGFRHVDGDAHHLGSRLGELDALLRGPARIGGVGHRHRLHDDRRTAADLDVTHFHADGLVELHEGHGRSHGSIPREIKTTTSNAELAETAEKATLCVFRGFCVDRRVSTEEP